jgi:hypothetical protein
MGRPLEETSKLALKAQNFKAMSVLHQQQQAQNVFHDGSNYDACTKESDHDEKGISHLQAAFYGLLCQ